MRHLLLTGAGFTQNWGGWLASEVFEYLIGAPEIDEQLRYELWRTRTSGGGFEDTLANLQAAYHTNASPENKRRLDAMTAALIGMFSAMRKAYATHPLEDNDSNALWVKRFLASFDAIFTLNQDTLLEDYYVGDVRWNEKWSGSYLPYMERINAEAKTHPYLLVDSPMTPSIYRAASPGLQPYYKLHGSFNWFSGTERLLVMGGNKAGTIRTSDVLVTYHQEFAQQLALPSTRLMVIGYGFGDQHINELICKAAEAGQLRIFLIDLLGIDVLNKQTTRTIRTPEPLVERLSASIVGASRRPLRRTFFSDPVELDKVLKFFQRA